MDVLKQIIAEAIALARHDGDEAIAEKLEALLDEVSGEYVTIS